MNKPTILLVDDEPLILESLARDLESLNYAVSTAENGDEAIPMLRKRYYNLIITDLIMPGPNGIEVLKEAKAASPGSGVFILTGYGDMTSAIEALRLGADDYLLKPCEPDEFVLRVERFLEKQENSRLLKLYENILPVCVYCKSIRDDANVTPGTGSWVSMEQYIDSKSNVTISHGCCPSCYQKHKDD